jgi:hypothetical protein
MPSPALIALLLAVCLIAPAAADSTSAPVTVVHYRTAGKLITLPVRVNGAATQWFGLDTGARHSVVDTRLARALKLRILANGRGAGAGHGTYAQQTAAPANIAIGSIRYRSDEPWVIDLHQTGFPGLIGIDMFRKYVVRIDPIARTIALYDPATFHYQGTAAPVPLESPEDRLYIRAALAVAGDSPVTHRLRVDTGSEDSVSDNLVRRSANRRKSRQGVGLGTSYVDYSGELDSVRIGPYAIHHVWGPSNDRPAIGMELLRRFTMTFDLRHGRLYLEPNRAFKEPVPAPKP